jgi:hypothetical protein
MLVIQVCYKKTWSHGNMLCWFTYGCGLTMNLLTNCLILDLKNIYNFVMVLLHSWS